MPASTASSGSIAPAPFNSGTTRSTATSGTARSIWTPRSSTAATSISTPCASASGRRSSSPMIRSMGFGEKFDLPFDNQRYGTIPDPDWMMRKYHRKWQGYDTVNMSIGQGMVLINPLQLAVMASRLATGKRVVPRLLKNKPVVPQTQLAVDEDHLDLHPQGDVGRRRSRNRRGRQAAARRHPDGGKDRNRADAQSERQRARQLHRRDNGSFATTRCSWASSPFDNPRYAAATIVEHGGFGAAVAAPLIRDTLTFLYDKQKALAEPPGVRAEHRRNARKNASRARLPPGAAPTACRHSAANGMITSAIIPKPLARLPWRLIFLVIGNRDVRADRPLFGGGRFGAAVGDEAGASSSSASCAIAVAMSWTEGIDDQGDRLPALRRDPDHADRRRGAGLRQQGRAAVARHRARSGSSPRSS